MGYIYKIVCKANKKFYIGSAVSVKERLRQHRKDLRRGRHVNKHLQRAWNKYGEDQFDCETIEEVVLNENLIKREQYWIDFTKCCDSKIGFNLCPTAGSTFGLKLSKAAKNKISKAIKGRPASPLLIEKMSKEWILTTPQGEEIKIRNLFKYCKENNIKIRSIRQVITGDLGSWKGWKCRYSNQTAEEWNQLRQSKRTPKFSKHTQETIDKLSKEYIVTTPENEEFKIKNLRQFCFKNGLLSSEMSALVKGNIDFHKGWKCRYASMSKEEWQGLRESKRGARDQGSAYWLVKSPDGVESTIRNLSKFCRDNGLCGHLMRGLDKGRITYYKGWCCKKVA